MTIEHVNASNVWVGLFYLWLSNLRLVFEGYENLLGLFDLQLKFGLFTVENRFGLSFFRLSRVRQLNLVLFC